jgi:hypothetical protein
MMSKAMRISVVAVLVLLTGMVFAVAQSENVKSLGKDAAEFKNDRVHAAVDWACVAQHPKEKWAFLEVWIMPASRKPIGIRRGDISLVLPDGTRLPVPGQKEVTSGLRDIRRVLATTIIPAERTSGAFQPRRNTIRFGLHEESSSLRLAFDAFSVDYESAACGRILFENPWGIWEAGEYRLEIKNGDVDIAIPFTI